MRAAIHNPYLDSLGGGERYSLAFATTLVNLGYQVDIEWKNPSMGKRLEERFGIKLEGINFVKDIKRGEGYDYCFWVSDGSIPTLHSRKNILHFQFPFHGVKGNTLINKMKLFRINRIVCNSYFTKGFVDQEYGVKSLVIYPPVDVERIKPKRKTNSILFVGRFSQLTQAKNQDVLIHLFKKFYDKGYSDWELILAGGVEVGVGNYIEKLAKMTTSYPVKIISSPTFKNLLLLYGQAKIFWSAVGFGANGEKEPEKLEHFGISLVEGMTAGCVPIVYNAGGYKEIVSEGENGFLWETQGEIIKKTIKIIGDNKLYKSLSYEAVKSSQKYSFERFAKDVEKIL